MGLESTSPAYISTLVATNPAGGDDRSTADDHLRYIKTALQTSFPNVNGAVTPTPAEFNLLSSYGAGPIPKPSIAAEWTAQQNFDAAAITFSATPAWDLNTHQVATLTLSGNITAFGNPSNKKAGSTAILIITVAGAYTIAWNAAFKWAFGAAPTVTSGQTLICTFVTDGTSMFGSWTTFT